MAEGPYQTRLSGPQPTASTARIDLSASPSRASAAGRTGYRRFRLDTFPRWSIDPLGGWVNRTEDCACRGQIVTPWPCPDEHVIAAVAMHNASLLHAVWRARRAAA